MSQVYVNNDVKINQQIKNLDLKKCECNRFVPNVPIICVNCKKSIRDHTSLVVNEYLQFKIFNIKTTSDQLIANNSDSECRQFRLANESTLICGCGRAYVQHENETIRKYLDTYKLNEEWDDEKCTESIKPTDAYGEVIFLGHSEKSAKYVKLSHTTDVSKIIELLYSKSYWHLKKPKMLISVSGGTKISISPEFKAKFCQGLYKIAKSTDAWIIDGGSYMGVMQLVGEAFKEEHNIFEREENKSVILGVANWTTIRGREVLKSKDRYASQGPVEYEMRSRKSAHEKSTNLDPYHSHFILVDNGRHNEFGGEIKLRSRLEKALSRNDIPIVMLLLGGGRHTVVQVKESLKNNVPCIFFDETGKFSNVFSFILRKIENKEENLFVNNSFSPEFRHQIKKLMKQEMAKINVYTNIDPSDETVEPILRNIEEIFSSSNLHLLSYFQFKSNFESNDVDVAILKSLFKSLKYESDEKDLFIKYREQFELCSDSHENPKVIEAFLIALKRMQKKEEIQLEKIVLNMNVKFQNEILKDIEVKLNNEEDELLKRYNEQLILLSGETKWKPYDLANLIVFIQKERSMKNLFMNNRFNKEFKAKLIKEGLNYDLIDDFESIFLKNAEKSLHRRFREQLKLCLKWNRYDMAKEYILTYSEREKVGPYDEFMFDAVKFNRVEFVKDFLENGFVLKNWTTYRLILKLYNTIPKTSLLYKILSKQSLNDESKDKKDSEIFYNGIINKYKGNAFTFKQIGSVIQMLLNEFYPHKFANQLRFTLLTKSQTRNILSSTDQYGKSKEKTIGILNGPDKESEMNFDAKCENSEHELFLFNVLLERFEMAKLFWHAGNNQLCSALVASKILRSYALKVEIGKENYLKQAEEYERLACNVLQKCFDQDSELVNDLLLNKVDVYGKISTLDIAISANSIEFISQITCQNLLNGQWYGQIESDTPYYKIYLCAVFPFLAPYLIEFKSIKKIDKDKLKQLEKDDEDTEEETYDEDAFSLVTEDTSVKNSTSDLIPPKQTKNSKIYYAFRNYFKLIMKFLNSPVVKLFYHQVSYILFLLLLSYVVMCEYTPVNYQRLPISVYEIVLITWISTITLEEFRKLITNPAKTLKGKWLSYIFQNWNIIGVAAIIFYYSALVLRLIPDSNSCFVAARIIMACDVILWYVRTLSSYWHAKQLGPMLLLIQKIIIDLLYFLLIILLALFAFGVSTQSLLFQSQVANSNLLKNIFFPSFFVIFKEYYTRNDIMTAGECKPSNSSILNHFFNEDCPNEIGSDFSLVIYVFYVVIIHLLLLCLLTAIFTNKFNTIQLNAKKTWKFERYTLINEYHFKPILPPPFIVISHLFIVFRVILAFFIRTFFIDQKNNVDNKTRHRFIQIAANLNIVDSSKHANNNYALNKLESSAVSELIMRQNKEKYDSTSYSNNLEALNRKIDVLNVKFNKLESELIEAPKLVINYSKSQEMNKSKKSRRNLNLETSSRSFNIKYLQDINKLQSSLTNTKADPDILSIDDFLRPQLHFNNYDERYKVDRTSCNGAYLVQNRIPICPVNRSINGRGSLFYWGPNHASIVIITRNLNNTQMLIKESKDGSSFKFPRIFKRDMRNVNKLSRDDTNYLINKLFEDDQIDFDYKEELISYLVDNSKIIGKYIPNSEMNTKNAWLEYTVINCFDKLNYLTDNESDKFSFKSIHFIWKDLTNDFIRQIALDDPFMASFLIRISSENNSF